MNVLSRKLIFQRFFLLSLSLSLFYCLTNALFLFPFSLSLSLSLCICYYFFLCRYSLTILLRLSLNTHLVYIGPYNTTFIDSVYTPTSFLLQDSLTLFTHLLHISFYYIHCLCLNTFFISPSTTFIDYVCTYSTYLLLYIHLLNSSTSTSLLLSSAHFVWPKVCVIILSRIKSP